MRFYRQNARHTGHFHFPFAVEFDTTKSDMKKFIEVRDWCWETFGPGVEWTIMQYQSSIVRPWIWISDNDGKRLRVLFSNEKQYTFARLKWEQ